MLVTGVFIAVALIALLAAFFLSRGDTSARNIPTNAGNPVLKEPEGAAAATPLVSQSLVAFEGSDEEAQPFYHAGRENVQSRYEEEPSIPTLNRKVYELAGQLRSLQRQSQEIERSLAHLSGIIEHMDERSQHSASIYASGTYRTGDGQES